MKIQVTSHQMRWDEGGRRMVWGFLWNDKFWVKSLRLKHLKSIKTFSIAIKLISALPIKSNDEVWPTEHHVPLKLSRQILFHPKSPHFEPQESTRLNKQSSSINCTFNFYCLFLIIIIFCTNIRTSGTLVASSLYSLT